MERVSASGTTRSSGPDDASADWASREGCITLDTEPACHAAVPVIVARRLTPTCAVWVTALWLGYTCTFEVQSRTVGGFTVIRGYDHAMEPIIGWVSDYSVVEFTLETEVPSDDDSELVDGVLC